MMTTEEYRKWSLSLGLSEQTYTIIEQIRNSQPSRRVGGHAGNVSGRYPSKKMGMVIQFESHRNELAGIYEMEYDSSVLEYYDQPPKIKLLYSSKNGRQVGVLHTADFFVIRSYSAGWEEWKTVDSLKQLTLKMPSRYVVNSNGNWRCPPGEEFAESVGLYYRLRVDTEINWKLQRNLYFLSDYLSEKSDIVPIERVGEIVKIVSQNPGILLSDLLSLSINHDEIYKLIASEKIYIDLSSFALATSPEIIPVYLDKFSCEALTKANTNSRYNQRTDKSNGIKVGESGIWDGKLWHIINIGETEISLLSSGSKIIQLPESEFKQLIDKGDFLSRDASMNSDSDIYEYFKNASETDCIEASRRYQIIAPYLQGEKVNFPVPSRTFFRWVSSWRQAETEYGYGYLGLLPQKKLRGNRNTKLPDATQKLMDEFIASDYESLKQKGKFAAYCAFKKACDLQGVMTPSYQTFVININKKPNYEQKLKRQGKRVAYESEPFYWSLELTTPRHGDRPFEICHIDHTQLDIELVSSRNSINLGRPWATFLTDAYSRRILAIYLTFDPPSYRSCMMILRECVRRHGRLPQTLVVDGGKEFQSIYFEKLLAAYCCTKKTRPAAKPRFGSVCERIFGSANTMFIHNLQGNTQITRNIRGMTTSVNPRNLAIWTISSLYQNLCDWAYEFYDNKEHPALSISPKEAFTAGLFQTGLRSHKIITYDDSFRIFTLPTTAKGTAKVIPNNGVKINNIYYWHNSFRSSDVEKTQVSVRYDPFNIGVAYTYVKGQWLTCISQYYSSLAGHTEREIMVASVELRKQYKNSSKKFSVTASDLAEFLNQAEQQEVVLLQRMRDIETKEILSTIDPGIDQEISPIQSELLIEKKVVSSPDINTEEIKPYEEFW
jgi:putative transposase